MSIDTRDKIYFAYTSYIPKNIAVDYGLKGQRATIALQMIGDDIHYGISVCSTEDNFSKAKGRQEATDRLKEGFGKFNCTHLYINHIDSHAVCLYFLRNMVNDTYKKLVSGAKMQQTIAKRKLAPKKVQALLSTPSTHKV